jgi:hypothetical protein
MVQELRSTSPSNPKTNYASSIKGEKKTVPAIKIWKSQPTHFLLLETLNKKGDMVDTDLFDVMRNEFDDFGFKDFNELLMRLEVSGKIRTSSLARGKRRVELVH